MLPSNEIHLWLWEVDQDDPAYDIIGSDVLSESEIERAARFRFARDRRLFRFAHSSVRRTLAAYLGRRPNELQFTIGSHGRPELSGGELRFNLTHTHGLAGCVVTLGAECGVDAESIHRKANLELVARNVFTDSERASIASATDPSRRFFEFWTLKEAYIKARALGLSLPLREISFDVSQPSPSVEFGPRINDDVLNWRFWSGSAFGTHQYGVAVSNGKKNAASRSLPLEDFQLRIQTKI